MRLVFGGCTFDRDARLLRRDGREVQLTPKAFELLSLLLERRPNAVGKAEIRDRLWPQTFVSDVNLARLAFEVRQAIGDDARKARYLRTVRAYGYAFAGVVEDPGSCQDTTARCRLVLAKRELALATGDHILGRGSNAAVVLNAAKISRSHARIHVGQRVTIEDLDSKNGTFVNGRRIARSIELSDGDEVRIGTERILFRAVGQEAPTETAEDEEP